MLAFSATFHPYYIYLNSHQLIIFLLNWVQIQEKTIGFHLQYVVMNRVVVRNKLIIIKNVLSQHFFLLDFTFKQPYLKYEQI